jgi:uncharacterized RDD family membrane protein YckC
VLAADAAEGLCPACLLAVAAESSRAEDEDGLAPSGTGAPEADEGPRFSPDQQAGGYRIVRLLGRGGMGEVYEAEHLESARRVALKVLRQRFHQAEDRERFLREGRLAASISHPHAVYIFGSDEVDGIPVISMELLPGGTLKDRVTAQGPLPPREAAAITLDILSGLDAAQAAGILHRDIKPSNCFVDADGTVKIGDFGLSISTQAHETAPRRRRFEGTPSFAAPEQLRGEALDVRTDVYAVGATLYYLLTGRTPFEPSTSLDAQIAMTMPRETPPSPRSIRSDIPEGLSRVVMQCLSPDPAQRPPSHAALAEAVRPFAAGAPVAAPRRVRALAWFVDEGIVSLGPMVAFVASGRPVLDESAPISDAGPFRLMSLAAAFAYFFLTEGYGGASPGKRLLGLCVRRVDGTRATWGDVALRTMIYLVPELVVTALVFTSFPWFAPLTLVPGLLLVTMRRRNGWAAVHDLLSATRVRPSGDRPVRTTRTALPPFHEEEETGHLGPFAITAPLGTTDEGQILAAFDPQLRRPVWIHRRGTRTAPMPRVRCQVSRSTRLRWLAGRQTAEGAWDAFEAPSGMPFERMAPDDLAWPEVRRWLMDLVRELTQAQRDGTLPALGLDRLWLRGDRRIVLLDFPVRPQGVPVADAAPAERARMAPTPEAFVSAVARYLLQLDRRHPPLRLPLFVQRTLDAWVESPPALADAELALQRLPAVTDQVRIRRALVVTVPATFVVMTLVSIWLFMQTPVLTLVDALNAHGEMIGWLDLLEDPPPESRLRDPALFREAERYVAARFGSHLTDLAVWRTFNAPIATSGSRNRPARFTRLRPRAEALARQRQDVSADELRALETTFAPENAEIARTVPEAIAIARAVRDRLWLWLVTLVLAVAALSTVVISLFAPGGLLLRAAGLVVVTADSREIGRARSFVRALLAMSPVFIALGIVMVAFRRISPRSADGAGFDLAFAAAAVPALIVCTGVVWTVVRPRRSLHDRLTGVSVVHR